MLNESTNGTIRVIDPVSAAVPARRRRRKNIRLNTRGTVAPRSPTAETC